MLLNFVFFDLGASEESTSGYFEHGTLAKLYIEGKKIQDWEKLEEELKLVKNCLLELIAEEKRIGIKICEL